jgi:hypothetical protein
MDEDYKIVFENLNKFINSEQDYKTKSIIFEYFLKGLQIGLKHKYLDFNALTRFLKTNV